MGLETLNNFSNNVAAQPTNNENNNKKKRKYNTYVLNDKDRDEVKDLCINNVPFWNTLTHEDIELQLVTCSVTNITYIVTMNDQFKNFPITKLIVKKTTPYNTLLYDRDLQFHFAKLLGDNNCGPKIIGKYGFYTIQQWVEGTLLNNSQFRNLSVVASLGSSIAKFHKKATEILSTTLDKTPASFTFIDRWSEHIDGIIKKHNLDLDYNEIKNYYDIYKKVINDHLKNTNSVANSVMFCHNDLFYKNILDIQHGLYFIDFDYSGFNYVGWDFGYLFKMVNTFYDPSKPPHFRFNNLLTEEMKSVLVSVYLSQLLDKNVLPSDPLVKEFLDSVEVHMLGPLILSVYWIIMMMDKPVSETVERLEYDSYLKLRYSQFKDLLKKLKDNNVIQY